MRYRYKSNKVAKYYFVGAVSGNPVATSTPRGLGAQPGEDQHNTSADDTEREINTRPSSASSDLTQISTTDVSSHGDRDDDDAEKVDLTHRNISETSQKYISSMASSGSGSGHSRELTAKLSDVEVSLEGVANVSHSRSNSDPPPPLPVSPPPSLDDMGEKNIIIYFYSCLELVCVRLNIYIHLFNNR